MTPNLAPFKTLLFGFAFSPSLFVNVLETARIAYFFGAKLILLHVGKETIQKTEIIEGVLGAIEYPGLPIEVQRKKWKAVRCYHGSQPLLSCRIERACALDPQNGTLA